MRISEADKALGAAYREIKAAHGGKKTAPKGKYGFKSIQFLVQETDGTTYGPFLGRGKALTTYHKEIRKKGKSVEGVRFIIQEIFKPRDKKRAVVVDSENVFTITKEKATF